MAAFIMSDKFYAHRVPAWHHLGIVSNSAQDAAAVATLIQLPTIELMPMYIHGQQKAIQVPGHHSITAVFRGIHDSAGGPGTTPQGGTIIDGNTLFHYGVVSDEYQLVTHQDFIEVWDRATGHAPVETMGLLYDGHVMFVTAELPKIDIKGDEVKLYLFGHNPVNGKTAIRCRTTGVRAVCHNTVSMILTGKTDHAFRASHIRANNILFRLEEWLKAIWEGRKQTAELMKEAYGALATVQCSVDVVQNVMSTVYPLPQRPEGPAVDPDGPEVAMWEAQTATQQEHQQSVMTLFESSRTITPATRGTMWGLYNAVVEYEDFGRPRVSALSKVMGQTNELKERAFAACHKAARMIVG